MAIRDRVKAELDTLDKEGREILKDLLATEGKGSFRVDYQSWYTRALRAVHSLAPDRYEEFRKYYEPDPKRKDLGYGSYVIQDYMKNVAPSGVYYRDFDTKKQAAQGMMNQLAILGSLTTRIESVLTNIEAHLQADLQDAELATARSLIKISPRAAGALAGVILETYLQRVAEAHGVKVSKKNPTISDLNDPLKQAEVYDTSVWRKISYLADLRNLCSHKKSTDPSPEQALELVEGVDWVSRNVS